MKSEAGIIGLGTMGSALARNLQSKGFRVSIFNRTREKTDKFIKKFGRSGSKNFQGFHELEKFVESLERERKIILMVPAGDPVDEIIGDVKPFLKKGDSLMDGGNSFYKDTERRQKELEKSGIPLLGCGISGGEKGALIGPSMMPGGPKKAWKLFRPLLEKIAAKDFSGKPCVAYMGEGGSGHYVKMIHNGIEYALMQCIAEIWSLGASQKMFENWNVSDRAKLNSYLIEETANVLAKKDFEGRILIDQILDVADQKGTGIWTAQESLEQGIAVNTIFEAVATRLLSTWKDLRVKLAKKFNNPKRSGGAATVPPKIKKETLGNALFAAFLMSYAQGFSLLEKYSHENSACQLHKFHIFDRAEIARIWQGGCIIRSKLLKNIQKAFSENTSQKNTFHLFENPEIQNLLTFRGPKSQDAISCLRITVEKAVKSEIPAPALSSALAYFDTIRSEKLPINLIQALRDAFGAHGYKKIGQKGNFHTDWNFY